MITDIVLEPVEGSFDVGLVEARLDQMLHARRDPFQPGTYLLAEDDDQLARAEAQRQLDQTEFPTYVILVMLSDRRIWFASRKVEMEPVRELVEWVRARYQVRILDDELNDLTSYCQDSLDFLFE